MAPLNTLMQAPPTLCGGTWSDQNGTLYNIPLNGQLQVPSTSVQAAIAAGFTQVSVAQAGPYTANAATTAATLAAASVAGGLNNPAGQEPVVNMTGTLGAGAALTLPTVAQLLAVIPNAVAGMSYFLRIINSGGGAFSWTLTTAAGWTLNGTMTVAQNTFRDFIITITSVAAATATVQAIGTGTNS